MKPTDGPMGQRPQPAKAKRPGGLDQVVLVFQGGGALGAYQAGVYQALHEAGVEPDWVIGTSIGAINAGIIAGNAPGDRVEHLREFWKRVEQSTGLDLWSALPWIGRTLPNWSAISQGINGFFKPNPLAFLGMNLPLPPDGAGYYTTAPLEKTLNDLIDFDRLNACSPRLTVGAAQVRNSRMRYFDSKLEPLAVRHIMASGALPPAFPAIRIDGELYWDGGILSNTPVEVVFDDNPRRNSLVFAVHIWNPDGSEPDSIAHVMHRQKDIQYSSRAASHIARQQQIHRLRHIIAELTAKLPQAEREDPQTKALTAYGCLTRMHVVRLLAPRLDNEDHTKDIDFSRHGIAQRWQAGYVDAQEMLEKAAWEAEVDPVEGFYLHEMKREMTAGA